MDYPFNTLRIETVDRIATLTLNRAHTLNSLTPEVFQELGQALASLRDDKGVRVAILTGAGRGFCSGLELGVLKQADSDLPRQELRAVLQSWQQVLNDLENLPQVSIAAVNGPAIGSGVELMLCCDFRIASTRALFGMPEASLGLIPDLGGITRLARTVGPAWAKEILLRARNLSPMEALRVGLVNRVAEPGDLIGTARKWANQFAALPPDAVRAVKRLTNAAFDQDLATALRLALDAQMELLGGDAFHVAMQGDLERNG